MSPAAERERHLTREEESALCARYQLRIYFLGDRRVVQLLRDEGWVSEREAGRAMDAIENKEWMLGQQRSAAMMSNRMRWATRGTKWVTRPFSSMR